MHGRFGLIVWAFLGLSLWIGSPNRLAAEDMAAVAGAGAAGAETLPSPTLGGVQFWADELFFHDWRIQREAATGHCRLLDGHCFQHAQGTYDECLAVLERIKVRRNLPPMQGKGVILLHGLTDTRLSMAQMATYLEEQGGYAVFNVGYPSTRGRMADYARSLANIVQNLTGIEEVNFVAHSMGNIVVRRYLGDQVLQNGANGWDPRIKRFVMLGPPNHGSVAAVALAENPLFVNVCGRPGQELGRDWEHLEKTLATPSFDFAIIAGGMGNSVGFNPLLRRDNDGIVTVESTQLEGAKDFAVVPVLHHVLMNDQRVQRYTLNFLKTGRFREEMQNAK